MRAVTLLLVAVLVAACGSNSPTGPKGIDPSILVTNWSDDTATVTWASDSGIVSVKVPPRTSNVCTRWTQGFDSLYTQVAAGSNASVTTPWVHFSQYQDYFQVDTVFGSTSQQPGGAATAVTNHLAAAEC